jgi:hypothetical protein
LTIKRGKSNLCAGNFRQNGRRRLGALSMSDVWKELLKATSLAATHER